VERALEVLGFGEILDTWYKISVLDVLKSAVENNEFGSFVLQTKYGLHSSDLKYLFSIFPELRIGKKPSPSTIMNRISELRERLRGLSVKMLKDMELWIFPKWRSLIGAVYMGMFEGRPIRDILWSSVAILIPSVNDIFRYRLLSREECVGIFGLGVYTSEFMPERSTEPTRFSMPIHGVLLETKMYEKAIYSKKELIVPKYSEYFREHLIRIPLGELVGSKFASRFFGPVVRKISGVIGEFLDAINMLYITDAKVPNLTILSAWRGAFNKLLVKEKHLQKLSVAMIKGVPGVVGYEGILDKLTELPPVHDPEVFVDRMRLLWARFSVLGDKLLEGLI